MDTSIRRNAGPRDWSPDGDTYIPMARPPRTPRAPFRLRFGFVGLLALLTGAVALLAETVEVMRPDIELLPHFFLGPLAIVLGIIGLARLFWLGVANRVGAVVGLSLGTVATLVLAASLTGILDVASTTTPLAQPEALAAEQAELTAMAGYLETALIVGSSIGPTIYPLTLDLDVDQDRMPYGQDVRLPEGARMAYVSDGTSYDLVIIGKLGTFAHASSVSGVVTGTLSD